jgi:hypothetical protein
MPATPKLLMIFTSGELRSAVNVHRLFPELPTRSLWPFESGHFAKEIAQFVTV